MNKSTKFLRVFPVCLLTAGSLFAGDLTFTASGSPAAEPDANGETVDAWVFEKTDPQATAGFEDGAWTIGDLDGDGGAMATHTFGKGPIVAGQTVSLAYKYQNTINDGKRVGIRFLDANNVVQAEFSYLGGGANGFEYGDSGNEFAWQPTGKKYDPDAFFIVVYKFGDGDTYEAEAGESDSANRGGAGGWSGAYTSPITQIQVFTEGGNNSGQFFNNLVISTGGAARK